MTRRTTVAGLAPLISAASSSAGSRERMAAAISRNTSGDRCSPSTSIIPGRLNTSSPPGNRPRSSPIRPLARKIQEIVYSTPGTISGTNAPANTSRRQGRSVLTTTKARAVPVRPATRLAPAANQSELPAIAASPTLA